MTTHTTDEPIVIANLYGFDVKAILDTPEEQRMAIIWSLMAQTQSNIPKLIILNTTKQINLPGSRWAPKSLLGPHDILPVPSLTSSTATVKHSSTRLTSQGLCFSSWGAKLSKTSGYREIALADLSTSGKRINGVYIRSPQDTWYMVAFEDASDGDLSITDVIHGSMEDYVLVTILPLHDLAPSNDLPTIRGVLATVATREQETMFLHGKGHVVVAQLTGENERSTRAAYDCARRLGMDEDLTAQVYQFNEELRALASFGQSVPSDAKSVSERRARLVLENERAIEMCVDALSNAGIIGVKIGRDVSEYHGGVLCYG